MGAKAPTLVMRSPAGTREGLCSAGWLLYTGISPSEAWGPGKTGPVSWGARVAASVAFPLNSGVKTITLLHHYKGGALPC